MEACEQVLEIFSDKANWDELQKRFLELGEDDQSEIIQHFNATIENCGDSLFGDDVTADDFIQFMVAEEDENQELFVETLREVGLLDEIDDE